jgi:hypothetical protein
MISDLLTIESLVRLVKAPQGISIPRRDSTGALDRAEKAEDIVKKDHIQSETKEHSVAEKSPGKKSFGEKPFVKKTCA